MKKFKLRSEFSGNVLTLMTGTTISQAIPIAISPILTRLYTPQDFGLLAVYLAIAVLIGSIAGGRYELAIMLPEKDIDAFNIMVLSIIISICISLITFLVVYIFNGQITALLGNKELAYWLYFIPFTVLATGIYQSFNYWSNRKKHFKRLAASRIVQSGTTASSHLAFGFGGLGSTGLIVGQMLGQTVAVAVLGRLIWKQDKNKCNQINMSKMYLLAKKYVKFPKFDLAATFINVFSHQIIHILFNIFFGAVIAGFYYLTQKLMGLPISLIAQAIGDVFKQKASEDFKKVKNAKRIYISTFKKLFILALIPSLILYFFSVKIFTFVFGSDWVMTGEFVKMMIPMFFLKFIASPLSFMLYIGEKQHINLYSQFLFLFATVISFLIGETPYDVVYYISVLFSCVYLYYIYLSAKIAKVF